MIIMYLQMVHTMLNTVVQPFKRYPGITSIYCFPNLAAQAKILMEDVDRWNILVNLLYEIVICGY